MNYFNKIGTMDVSRAVYKIAALEESAWHEYTFRQDTHEHHIHSQTLPVFFNENLNEESKPTKYLELFEKELSLLENILYSYYRTGRLSRCMIVNLLPNKNIIPHIDSDPALLKIKRHHVPIVTNSEVIFTCGNESLNMQTGEIWEFRNDLIHSVSNNSMFRRIHIIADWDLN